MFRPMRRKKKEICSEDVRALLRTARRGVLAVNGDDGYPYAVPINFLYDEDSGRIYFHGARVGHKADAIRRCDKVCFTVFGNETVRETDWAPYVQSVVVFGRCRVIADREAALAAVRRFAMKYYPDDKTADDEIAASGAAVQMYEIEIEHLTGKEIQER